MNKVYLRGYCQGYMHKKAISMKDVKSASKDQAFTLKGGVESEKEYRKRMLKELLMDKRLRKKFIEEGEDWTPAQKKIIQQHAMSEIPMANAGRQVTKGILGYMAFGPLGALMGGSRASLKKGDLKDKLKALAKGR